MENDRVTVLLVEDDAGDAELVRESFRRSRHGESQLVVAESGERALDILRNDIPARFGLILLDLSLPDGRGYDLIHQIRELPHCSHIPVVVLTGSTDEGDMRQSYANGANAYLVKPVDLGRFIRMVNLLDEFWVKLVSVPGTAGDA